MVFPVGWASIAGRLALGDLDAALAKLKQFRPTMFHLMGVHQQAMLKHSRVFDPIRDEPEFKALLEEYRRNSAEQRKLLAEMDLELPTQ